MHRSDPGGVGHVVHYAAHDRILEMGVQIDKARHYRSETEVLDFLVGVAQFQHVGLAEVADLSVAHEHSTIGDRLGRYGQNIMCAQ